MLPAAGSYSGGRCCPSPTAGLRGAMGPGAAAGRDAVCRTRPRPHCAAARIQNSLLLTSAKTLPFPTPHSGHTCLRRGRLATRPSALDTPRSAMSAEDYVSVRVEDDVEAVIIENSEMEDAENGLSAQDCVSVEQNAQVNSDDHYMTQLAYGGEGLSVLSEPVVSQMSHSTSVPRDGQNPEEMEYVFLHKRRRLTPSLIRSRETEYEDGGSVIYEYEPDYECGSVVSEASYTGDQQKTLMEVLNYCQAMYDAIQKLDKKFDLLHRKVSEMQHTRMKPLLLKPRPIGFTYRSSNHLPHGKIRVQKPVERESSLHISPLGQGGHNPSMRVRLQKSHLQANSAIKPVQQALQPESQQPVLRQSPPLPTIVSTHSLHPPYTVANRIPDLPPQPSLVTTVMESTANVASSGVGSPMVSSVMPTPSETGLGRNTMMMNYRATPGSANISKELPSSSVSINPSFEYVGDPKRNVKVLGNYLMKARQKTKPKYAARYLVRVLFPKETLLCSIMGVSARGRRTLDPNKVAAVREFLATHFPNYDLSEYGRDWKTCITNVNAMIRCLRCETKINPETTEEKEKPADTPDTSIYVDLNYNGEDNDVNSQSSQKMTSSTTNRLQNTTWDKVPEVFHAPSSNKLQSLEPMEHLGSPWRNVQLPFSVIYVAKGKSRPELSARYLIRHLFTEDVLVKSNVYGNLERGMCPLDCNRINALRDFLQENYPSFDLKETGYDWKACVAAINSTIRSLRHDHKKAAIGVRKKVLATPPSSEKSPSQSPTSVKPYESDTINLTD
ncbi:BEN domain-containing protein 2 isoform X2 [Chelonoidis abingdonii]|uniref:BEN domain-containing protein 2 isoform X2 n=2 Tax=Chelonoidis abingdonii TaxID=106734 RepID=UPI0013F26CFC|nr:BEN domain-containing protein 2 isoform X2 [Chelonoidis abingdonii]